jgi:predicted DNA-binding protein
MKQSKKDNQKDYDFTTIRIPKELEDNLRKLQYNFDCRSKHCVIEKLIEKELKKYEKTRK